MKIQQEILLGNVIKQKVRIREKSGKKYGQITIPPDIPERNKINDGELVLFCYLSKADDEVKNKEGDK